MINLAVLKTDKSGSDIETHQSVFFRIPTTEDNGSSRSPPLLLQHWKPLS